MNKHLVQAVAQHQSEQTGQDADREELQHIHAQNLALTLTQDPQHGAVVQMPRRKTPRRQGHRHRTQERGQQGHQVQKLLSAVQGLAHLRPPGVQGLQAHPANLWLLDIDLGPLGEGGHLARLAHHGQAPVEPAGRLHQLGGFKVGLVHHDAWRKVHETGTPIRLTHQHFGDAQRALTKLQVITRLDFQSFQQGRFGPHLALLRQPVGGHAGPVVGRAIVQGGLERGLGHRGIRRWQDLQTPAQRVTVGHHFERHQAAVAALVFAASRHGGKAQGGRRLQTQGLDLGGDLRCKRVVAGQDSIPAQELAGVALQTTFNPIGQIAHRGERGHPQTDRHPQQTQFTRAGITPQRTPSHRQEFHTAAFKSR